MSPILIQKEYWGGTSQNCAIWDTPRTDLPSHHLMRTRSIGETAKPLSGLATYHAPA